MKSLSPKEEKYRLEQANSPSTITEQEIEKFEEKQTLRKREAFNKNICNVWIKKNINSKKHSEQIVAKTLLSFINGDKPFATVDDKRGAALDQKRAVAMFYALVETNNIDEVSHLFRTGTKEAKHTIASLGERMGITSISTEFRNKKGRTPLYNEMKNYVKENSAVMAMGASAFTQQFDNLEHNGLSKEQWLSISKRG